MGGKQIFAQTETSVIQVVTGQQESGLEIFSAEKVGPATTVWPRIACTINFTDPMSVRPPALQNRVPQSVSRAVLA